MKLYNIHFISVLLILICGANVVFAEIDQQLTLVKVSNNDFNRPHDLTLGPNGQYLYVADMENNRIKVFDPYSLELLSMVGRGILRDPHDVSFDQQGRLIVADTGNNRLVLFQPDGQYLKFIQTMAKGLREPEGLYADNQGVIFVVNTGRHNVVEVSQGRITNRAGSAGRTDSDFLRPHDIEISSNGTLYVTDPGNNRIKLLNKKLELIELLGGEKFDFNEPKYIALDEKDWLYVADQHDNEIVVYDTDRQFITRITGYKIDDNQHTLNKPEGVEARNGHVWVSDTYNNRILLYKWVYTRRD